MWSSSRMSLHTIFRSVNELFSSVFIDSWGGLLLLRGTSQNWLSIGLWHRLDMELDLQSLFELHVYSCTHWLRLRNSPHPPHSGSGSHTRALLVRQDQTTSFSSPWPQDTNPPVLVPIHNIAELSLHWEWQNLLSNILGNGSLHYTVSGQEGQPGDGG